MFRQLPEKLLKAINLETILLLYFISQLVMMEVIVIPKGEHRDFRQHINSYTLGKQSLVFV